MYWVTLTGIVIALLHIVESASVRPVDIHRTSQSNERLRLIVDVDVGVDDALALLFFLRHSDRVDVIGITCLFGNTDVDTSCTNALRTINFLNRNDIPVYRGASKGLIPTTYNGSDWNGFDGFGGNAARYPLCSAQRVMDAPAALFIAEAANRYPGELVLVLLGPHTNVALAQRLDSTTLSKFKAVHIMGGNYGGGGKPLSDLHEYDFFNFLQDPEAAHLVLNELNSTTYMLPIETCNANRLTWDFFKKVVSQNNPKSRFFQHVTEYPSYVNSQVDKLDGIELCDLFMAAMVVYQDELIKSSVLRSATVELCGQYTRSMMIVEAVDVRLPEGMTKRQPNINIVTELNSQLLREKILEMIN